MSHRQDVTGALPDDVLQHVLTFLPLPEAVRTCVLARRWHHLWKSMTVLRVDGGGRTLNRLGVIKLNRFMNHFLLLRDLSVPVHEFEIELGTFRCQHEPLVNLWIRHALLCQARILRVHSVRDSNSFDLADLPLRSQHLTKLELRSVVLKDNFLNFASCPTLEELWISGCYIEADMILSQSVKQLTIIDCIFYPDHRTRISIPSLVTLTLTECWGRTPLLGCMLSLVAATVKLTDCDDLCAKEESGGPCVNTTCNKFCAVGGGSMDCVLLKGLSKAKSLELIAQPMVFIFRKDLRWCPTFSNLKALFLNEWCVTIDLHPLVCFLQHTPVLERLTVQLSEAPDNWMETVGNYNRTEQPFASQKLKVVEVKCEKFDGRVHKILMILSTNGTSIEHIYIQRSTRSFEGEPTEPMDITEDSGAGPQASSQHISPSENARIKSMIYHVIAQKQHLFGQQQDFLGQQEEEVLAWQRRQNVLDQILAQLSDYSASYSQEESSSCALS